MSQPAASYTPLESLFLFQSLLAQGLDPGAFSRVSEALRGNALIRGDDAYDPARLTPDALQQLFLLVLREEIKAEAEAVDGSDGASSPAASRKRKLGSPPLPSLKDAYQHLDKFPALVDRLYARYREHAVKRIRDDERRFAAVQKEIQLLERSENERLAKTTHSPASTQPCQPSGLETILTAGSKRGPTTPNTPVYPPVLPPTVASTPAGLVAASQLSTGSASTAAGTPVVRPSPSPSPNSTAGCASVLQPPAALSSQTASRPLPPPVRLPQPVAAFYGDVVGKSDASSQPGTPHRLATSSPAALQWEKPYDPAQASARQPSPLEATRQQPMDRLSPQHQSQQSGQPIASIPGKSGLVAPQVTGPLAAALPARSRPAVVTPVIPPSRPSLPQTAAARQSPSSNAASESALGPPTWSQTQVSQLAQPTIPLAAASSSSSISSSATTTTAPSASLKDKPYLSPYGTQPPRPAIPEHIIRQAAGSPNMRRSGPATPKTPSHSGVAAALARGFGTIWSSLSTPSTPGPMAKEADSPAMEPVSPPRRASTLSTDTPKPGVKRSTSRPLVHGDREPRRPRGRPPRSARASATPSFSGTRRSLSVVSLTDEPSVDHPDLSAKIKKEAMTPRLREDTGFTTADESLPGRLQALTPAGARLSKRKRQETPPAVPSAPPTGVLWTRGFTKVSSSALDQISSHRYANMFATGVRERDAPNYRQIVLQPLDITSIRASIKQGNKAAAQAAANLPEGDPGVANVWLPVSEDLMPPRGIVNSAQLERQLVHMFCNAIMYNPDPDRGPGAGFMKRSKSEGEESVGYHLDENGVVKNTRSMFVEVEKLLGDLRSAENDRGVSAPSVTRQPSVATPAEETADDEDDLVGDGSSSIAGTAKRRRVSTRN